MISKKYFYKVGAILVFLLILSKPIIPFLNAILTNKTPQLILVLGGDIDREVAGIRISKELNIPLLISGGSNPEYSDWLIQNEKIPNYLVKRDYRAKDTLANFTYIVDELLEENINHILLITSDYHLDRAKVVGSIIAGSRGIRITSLPVPCPSSCKEEGKRKRNIDIFRAVIWVATGKDLKPMISKITNYKLVK